MSIDYRLLKQGMNLNSIAHATGSKWEPINRIKERCVDKWENVQKIPGDISSETIKKAIYSWECEMPTPNYLQPDCEAILNRQKKESIQRKELCADYVVEAKEHNL